MTVSGCALTLTIALFTAQSAHAATKHKKPTRRAAPPAGATAEKRVVPPARVDGGAAATANRPEATAGAPGDSVTPTTDTGGSSPTTTTKAAKTKVYTFGAMDVEGKLKTPQLLYFLNRVKLELEMSAPDHRSFMKELERTADDPSL